MACLEGWCLDDTSVGRSKLEIPQLEEGLGPSVPRAVLLLLVCWEKKMEGVPSSRSFVIVLVFNGTIHTKGLDAQMFLLHNLG